MATYYFSTSGDDSTGDGSWGNPYKTPTKANTLTLNPDDVVAFKCGDTWTGLSGMGADGRLYLTDSGTAGHPIIVCSWYGSGTLGISGARPIFDGNVLVWGGTTWATCMALNPNYAPATESRALILTDGAYVTIQDIDVRNSAGLGVETGLSAHYCILLNISVSHTWAQNVYTRGDYNLVEACVLSYGGHRRPIASLGGASLIARYSRGVTWYRTTVRYSYGEGFNVYDTNDLTINRCLGYDNWGVQVYVDEADGLTVKNSLFFYTADQTWWRYPGSYPGNGMGFACERKTGGVDDPIYNNNIKVYGNIFINCRCGIYLGPNSQYGPDPIVFYNNTIIRPYLQCISTSVCSAPSNPAYQNPAAGSAVGNNVFYIGAGTAASVPSSPAGGGYTWSNNFWSVALASVDVDARGAGDTYGSPPDLVAGVDWADLPITFNGLEAAPKAGGNLIGKVSGIVGYTNLPFSGSVWPSNVAVGLCPDPINLGAIQGKTLTFIESFE